MAEPPPFFRVVVPHPEGASGGVENIPEELLAPGEQLQDELDHAGLDQELAGEDRAPAAAGEAKLPEKWTAPSP